MCTNFTNSNFKFLFWSAFYEENFQNLFKLMSKLTKLIQILISDVGKKRKKKYNCLFLEFFVLLFLFKNRKCSDLITLA